MDLSSPIRGLLWLLLDQPCLPTDFTKCLLRWEASPHDFLVAIAIIRCSVPSNGEGSETGGLEKDMLLCSRTLASVEARPKGPFQGLTRKPCQK